MQLLAKYSLPKNREGKPVLPPTAIDSLYHGAFAARQRNPFACCYFKHYKNVVCDYDGCEYLKQFGSDRKTQAYKYYFYIQTIPTDLWNFLMRFPLTVITEYIADMVPPFAIANLYRLFDLYYYFKGAVVLDLFSGICGWLMAFYFLPSHYLPRKWIAVDIEQRRLVICQEVAKRLGVDIVVQRRDLMQQYRPPNGVDIVIGSPPCHEFSSAKVSSQRKVDLGLSLVRRYFEIAKSVNYRLAVMEEATSSPGTDQKVADIAKQFGFRTFKILMRNAGAIQYRRERLIAIDGAPITDRIEQVLKYLTMEWFDFA